MTPDTTVADIERCQFPNEPTLQKLKEIETRLLLAESTNENMQKLMTVGVQIRRRQKWIAENVPEGVEE